MIDEIIKKVAAKAGISNTIAQVAVETVISVLKNKLPDVLGSQIDSFLGTSKTSKSSSKTTKAKSTSKATTAKSTKKAAKNNNPLGSLSDIIGGIGGLLGKK